MFHILIARAGASATLTGPHHSEIELDAGWKSVRGCREAENREAQSYAEAVIETFL